MYDLDISTSTLSRITHRITPIIKEQIRQVSVEYANTNDYDILLSIDLDEEINFFTSRKYIHFTSENIISQKVATIFEEKYLKQ